MTMVHVGLPGMWLILISLSCLVLLYRSLRLPVLKPLQSQHWSLRNLPLLGVVVTKLNTQLWPLALLKFGFVGFFLLIIFSGLYGSQIPERNLATEVTWNLWWSGIVFAVFFLGTSWCAICPWDTIANALVRLKIWRRSDSAPRLNLRLPKALRSLWPAVFLLTALTWLELGMGITGNPQATASLAILMLIAATAALALLEDKSFCRYICPVGRTIGVYSQLSPWALRHVNTEKCNRCTSLACYHGSELIAPCPTQLVVGRLQQNTYCLSCGNCTQSCPENNVSWSLHKPTIDAQLLAKPHLDEAGFMICLLALTGFHGLTMMPLWPVWISQIGLIIGDSGQMLASFSLLLGLSLLLPIGLYALCIGMLRPTSSGGSFSKWFAGFGFVSIPLSFSYHLSHNLTHLVRESSDWPGLLSNPLGVDSLPLSMLEKHQRHLTLWMPEQLMFALQSVIMIFGFAIAVKVIRQRGENLFGLQGAKLLPLYGFASLVMFYHTFMLAQDMVMRM